VTSAHLDYRSATPQDLDFLVWVDSADEGVSTPAESMSHADEDSHREFMRSFIGQEKQGALICWGGESRVGVVMWRYRNRIEEELPTWSVFNHISTDHFPKDGRFCEIYQLWVDPECRRRGIATTLKRKVADHAQELGITMLYTHTESSNEHVLDLNKKLGYVELRRGPIWDEIERVSLALYL
jgi:ribosomal protein S18 acetylase RimI-like enzyme